MGSSVVRGQLKKCPDGTVNTVYPPTEYKGSSQGRPPSGGIVPKAPHDDRVDALALALNHLRPDIRPGDVVEVGGGEGQAATPMRVKTVTHSIGSSNPCGEIAIGPSEPCTLLGVDPLPTPSPTWLMGIDWGEVVGLTVTVPRPTGSRLRPFDPLW